MPKIIGPTDGLVLGEVGSSTDRFMLDGVDSDGRLAVVEHTLGPGVLAAPMHFHTREDEFSYVIEGRFAAVLDGEEVYAEAGDFVFKPRGQWHTFWNPGDTPTRILELITPAGLEDLFKMVGGAEFDPDRMEEIANSHGCEVDEDQTQAVLAKHGLSF